ncbi:hypothetical protein [Pseudomonas sp. stari2]|uniref:hypothetical protein n=1 Tax=Pseudomonas sp. Stari2 TaxID=2954814 RepID=UPI00345CCA07
MFDLGIAKLHVGDLSPHWQGVAKNLDPEVVMVWVVFFEGKVYGVYLSVTAAAKAVAKIEADLAAGRKPQPQSATKVLLEKKSKEAELKKNGSSDSTPKP